jgi:hemolysin III
MSKPDELIVAIASLVESGQSNQMSLTVVTGGAVITGRLAPEAVWRQRVSEVLTDSAHLGEFSAAFEVSEKKDGPPTHLHFHVARILQGAVGIPETGGMYRVAIEDVSAWTVGDFSYSDQLTR